MIPSDPFLVPRADVIVADDWWAKRREAWMMSGVLTSDDYAAPEPPSIVMPMEPIPAKPAMSTTPVGAGLLMDLMMPASDWTAPTEPPNLDGEKELWFDLETFDPGLAASRGPGSHLGGYITGLALSVPSGRSWYFPTKHAGGNCDWDVVGWFKSIAAAYTGEIGNAQILYELIFLEADWGVTFPNIKGIHDPLIAAILINQHRLNNGLDAIGKEILGEGKDERLLEEAVRALGYRDFKTHMHELHARYVGPYGEKDPDLARRLMPVLMEKLREEDQIAIYDLERRIPVILAAMYKRGVRIDMTSAERLHANLTRELVSWVERLKHVAGPKADYNAKDSLIEGLQDRGVQLPRTAPTQRFPEGQPSVTEGVLVEYKGRDAMVDAVLACRRVSKIATYLKNSIIDFAVGGRLYPVFNQLRAQKDNGGGRGTISGRFSCETPNLQQVSKREKPIDDLFGLDDDIAASTRRLFIPEDGEEWQRDDLSQAEFRLTTHVAIGRGAEEARERYRRDPKMSFHKLCAEMLGIDPEDKKIYDRIKALNLGKSYGAQAQTISNLLRCSFDEAKTFIKKYESELPFTVDTFNRAAAVVRERGYITTVLGRRQRFPLWEPNAWGDKRPALPYDRALAEYGSNIRRAGAHKGLNFYNQGSCADIFKKAMVDIWEAGINDVLGPPLLLEHDELDHSIPRTQAGDEAGREVTRIMGSCVELKVPILVDTSRGPSWGDCQ